MITFSVTCDKICFYFLSLICSIICIYQAICLNYWKGFICQTKRMRKETEAQAVIWESTVVWWLRIASDLLWRCSRAGFNFSSETSPLQSSSFIPITTQKSTFIFKCFIYTQRQISIFPPTGLALYFVKSS